MSIFEFLESATRDQASDLFIVAGRPLSYKKGGKIFQLNQERIMPEQSETLVAGIYSLAHRSMGRLQETGDDDFSFAVPGLSRFRVSTYMQRGSLAAVIRVITFDLPNPDDLGIPEAVTGLSNVKKGLVLVTGRQRQVHHPGLHHRPDQPHPGEACHHPGGPAGVSAPASEEHHQPAGDQL